MQPVTPLRQQQQHQLPHQHHRSLPRSRRLTGGAATSTRSCALVLSSTPRADEAEESLAPPLALTRKRTRAASIPSPDGSPAIQAHEETHLDATRPHMDVDIPGGNAQTRRRAAGQGFRQAFEVTAKFAADDEEALVRDEPEIALDIPHQPAHVLPAGMENLRDLFANGRALYNATTTSLAAPAEIPNKKPRITHHRDETVEAASASKSRRAAAPLDTALATPKQTSTIPNDGGPAGSRRQPSKRAAAANATAALAAAGTNSTTKRRSASKNTAAGGSATRRNKTQKDDERRHQQEQDAIEWKKKYKRAFKSFVFYFDGFDMARKREAEKCVKDLGAQVESFFSKQVSHVVTTRAIPNTADKASGVGASTSALTAGNPNLGGASRASIFQAPLPAGKENAQIRNSSESPIKQSAANKDAFAGPSRRSKNRLGAANPTTLFPLKTPPKIRAFADLEKTESKDILAKAQSFGMKLWTVEKLQRVLERLIDNDSPSQGLFRQTATVYNAAHVAAGHAFSLQMNGSAPKPTLPSLLRAEAATGSTYERDLTTLRPDYTYFNPKNGYILVEDSSGEFQPAHAKEYPQRVIAKPGDEDRDTHWPTLWGGQEGRQAFYKASASYRPSLPSIELIRSNDRGCAPEQDNSLLSNVCKKQSTSQNSQLADPPSYLAASGNSQIITSNIQSATSTRSGQAVGMNGNKSEVRRVADGYIVDKRLARLGSKNAHIVTIGHPQAGPSQDRSVNGELARRQLARSGASEAAKGQPYNECLQQREKKPLPPLPKKPGYCENCRVRFEDFKTHTRTKKHRRFALDETNWRNLDELFSKIKRPIHPELIGLYDEAGCEIPSDIEASDKEEDDDSSDEDEYGEQEDSGYAGMSADYEINPLQTTKRRKLHADEEPGSLGAERAVNMAQYVKDGQVRIDRDTGDAEDEDSERDENDSEEEEGDEIISTSEEEQALETASDEEDEFVED